MRPEALCIQAVRESVSPCVPNAVNTISWEVLDVFAPNFQLWFTLGQRWTLQVLGSKVKVQGHSGSNMLENARNWRLYCFMAFNVILQITALAFTKLSASKQFGTRMKASVFGVKRSKVKVTASASAWPRDRGGIQISTLCVFFYFAYETKIVTLRLVQLLELIDSTALCVLSFQNDRNRHLPSRLLAVICEMSLQKTQQKVINWMTGKYWEFLSDMWRPVTTSGQIYACYSSVTAIEKCINCRNIL